MAKTDSTPATTPSRSPAEGLPAPVHGAPSGIPADVLTDMAAGRSEPTSSPLDIDALLDQDIAAWRPEAGEKLIGRVVLVDIAGVDSTFGAYPLLTIRRDDNGELVNVHAFHGVLRKELMRREVGEGDRLGIKYFGTAEGGDYGSYENYRVVVERAAHLTVADIEARK